MNVALAGVVQLSESLQIKGLQVPFPVRAHLGCKWGPQLGVHKSPVQIDVSLPLFLPSPLSKNK